MKRAVLTVVAALLAGTAFATTPSSRTVAALPSATPAALQYDEITRILIPPSTPPPPGTFQADYAIASQSREAKGGGLFGMMKKAQEMLKQLQSGRVMRYTIYGAKGLMRTDDVTAQTATISDCRQHQVITLNLDAKTYKIASGSPQACPTAAADASMPQGMSGPRGGGSPGTGDLTFTVTSTNLGPQTLEGIPTNGSSNSFEMKMTNATGSCQNMDATMQSTRYASNMQRPRASCPIAAAPPVAGGRSMDPAQLMFGQGCKPRIHGQGNFQSPFSTLTDVIDMYSMSNFNAGGAGHGQPMNMVTEIGNVTWLKGADADAAFAIPAGFTEAK